jgi:hypothetical protein
MILLKIFAIFVIAIQSSLVFAINVSWLPDDANAPLPLSSNFRNKLRSLCEKGENSHRQIDPKKQVVLKEMCKKLRKDDANILGAEEDDKQALRAKLILLIIICGVTWKASKQRIVREKWKEIKYNLRGLFSLLIQKIGNNAGNHVGGNNGGGYGASNTFDAKEARLRRFAQTSS